MRLGKNVKRFLSVTLASVMIIGTCFTANAETNLNGYSYSIEGGIITENTTFFDESGNFIQLTRTVHPNGLTQVTSIYGDEQIVKIGVLDYNAILSRINLEKNALKNNQTRADIAHGPNCYHVELATNEVTVTKEEAGVSAAAIAAILALSFTANPKIIASVASKAFSYFNNSDIAYEIITEETNEVYFRADDVYYTHCYHDSIYCYDDFDHYIKSYTLRHQAIGG